MQFYTGDWLRDPQLSMCQPATRGIWADLLAAMHQLDLQGVITGTREQLARVGRCSAVELGHALDDLRATNAADVTDRNGIVTVINRRMKREYNLRESIRLRVRKHRGNDPCNGLVTPDLQNQSHNQNQK